MPERGTVVAVRPGVVDLAMVPGDECGSCTACSANGDARLLENVPAPDGLGIGDIVEIDIPQAVRTRAQALIFLVPVVALVLGYMAGFLLGSVVPAARDTLGVFVALTCGAGAFAAVARWGAPENGDTRVKLRVRAIIAQAERPLECGGPSMKCPQGEEDQTRE